jgi:hypothetical protein
MKYKYSFHCPNGHTVQTDGKPSLKTLKTKSEVPVNCKSTSEATRNWLGFIKCEKIFMVHDIQEVTYAQKYFVCPLDGEKIFVTDKEIVKKGKIIKKGVKELIAQLGEI